MFDTSQLARTAQQDQPAHVDVLRSLILLSNLHCIIMNLCKEVGFDLALRNLSNFQHFEFGRTKGKKMEKINKIVDRWLFLD